MATFSVNQNRQFFVANSLATSAANIVDKGVAVVTNKNKNYLYFLNKGAGGLVRSDMVDIDKITYCKYNTAEKLRILPSAACIDLSKMTTEDIIPGQDYLVRITIKQYLGASDVYPEVKFAVVHATKDMQTDISLFFAALVKAIYRSQRNEVEPLYKVGFGTSATPSGWTLYDGNTLTISATDTFIGIYAAAQPWRRGLKKEDRADLEMHISPIIKDGDEFMWGTATQQVQLNDTASSADYAIKNGRKMADLEYFCMGERGDQYRGLNWPNNIDTEYLIDPTKEYDTLELHYSYVGSGVSSQKSEKDITIAIASTVDATSFIAVLTDAGVTVEK